MNQLTRKTIEFLDQCEPNLANHIRDLNRQLNMVSRISWRLAHWRRRNFSLDSHDKWLEETTTACKEAEPFLDSRLPKI